MPEHVIRAEGLAKTFRTGRHDLTIFEGLSLAIAPGESVALVGESGAGKSTLLQILGALDTATAGRVVYQGESLASMDDLQLAAYRNSAIGYVWQNCHLLPEFTALENVCLPLRIRGESGQRGRDAARKLLERVGLGSRLHHQSGELSGGEQQRVAIARALVSDPALLLADEPTGNLDERTGGGVMEMLLGLVRERGLAMLLATHNAAFAALCDRTLRFERGRLKEVRARAARGLSG